MNVQNQPLNEEKSISWLTVGNVIKNIPFLLLLAIMGLAYIGNAHKHIKLEREIDKASKQIKEQRWEYMSSKSEVMLKSKQSEVAKSVLVMGLEPLTVPPKKIVTEKQNTKEKKFLKLEY